MRTLALLILAAPVLVAPVLTGCATAAAPGPEGSTYSPTHPDRPSTFSRVGNAVLSVPETVVWWPYKIVTSAVRGGYDGAAGGIEKAPMPFVGVLASPLTAGVGVVHGALKGAVRGPAYVGSAAEFGKALGQPWVEPLPIW